MAKKLFNSLIDYIVVAGSDNDTGLSLPNSHSEGLSFQDKLFTNAFEANLTGAINFELAYYPATQFKFSLTYPPLKYSHDVVDNGQPETGNEEDTNLAKKLHQRRSTIKPFELPIETDILQNLPQFCFPSRMFISKVCQEPTIHYFVLTDIEGRKNYAIVLTYYREFYCCENSESDFKLVRVNDDADETEEKIDYLLVYVPTAIVLVSKFSYISVIKDCASSLYSSLVKDPAKFRQTLEDYAFALTHLPVPPPSSQRFSLILEYKLPAKHITILPQEEYGFDIFDLNLATLFHQFDIDTILDIVLAILSESKILFLSKHNGLITPTIQCFMKLIQPFKWMLPYVPLLPSTLIEYIEAPQPFIMGFNSNYRSLIDESHALVIVDIDTKKVTFPESIKLESFPKLNYMTLKIKLSDINFNLHETRRLISPSKVDWKSNELEEKQVHNEINNEVCDAFFEFFVDIFGDLYSFIKFQTKSFNKKKYLENVDEKYLPFYTQVLETSLFESFTSDLITNYSEKKRDYFYEKLQSMKVKLSQHHIDELNETPSKVIQRTRTNSVNVHTKPIVKIFEIKHAFATKNIKEINKELESSNTLVYKDCLLYLRGLYNLAINKWQDGLKDFYSIESNDLFPKRLFNEEVYPMLGALQKDRLKEQDFYKNASEFRKIVDDNHDNSHLYMSFNATSLDLIEHEFENMADLDYAEFSKRLNQTEIRIDSDTAERLFKALTLEETSNITTFELFVDKFQIKDEELERINRFLPSNKLRSIEFALKISNNTVVPNQGLGRVVLTQKCLYFIEQSTNKRKLLIELKNIKTMENTQYSLGVFHSKRALKITCNTDPNIVVYLCDENTEINVWFIVITEICSAIYLSTEQKDTSVIQYAAKNVCIINAVFLSGSNPLANHNKDLEKSLRILSYYTMLREDKTRRSTDAKQILHLRIKPSSREFHAQSSIESMIYVNIDQYPTIWCAIGNKIKIYDAITWHDEATDLKINENEKITCLLHDSVHSKVWIGTIERCLYVTDTVTRIFNKKIVEHSDVVVSIAYFTKNNWILSGASNGEIIVWDAKKFEKCDVFNVKQQMISLLTIKDFLITVSTDQIEVYDEKFQSKQKFSIQAPEKISCACLSSTDSDINEDLLWVGNSRNGIVHIWSLVTFELKMRVGVDDCLGYRSFLCVDNLIWAGSKDGKLSLFDAKTFECEKSFDAHTDSIRSLCYFEDNKFVISGSGSKDGSVAVWRAARITKRTIMNSMKKMLLNHDDQRRASLKN